MANHSQQQNSSDPQSGRFGSKIGILFLAVLVAAGFFYAMQRNGVFGASPQNDAVAKNLAAEYVKDCSTGNGPAALGLTQLPKEDVDADVKHMQQWGTLSNVAFDKSTYSKDHDGWKFEGTARFANGTSPIEANVYKIDGQYRVHNIILTGKLMAAKKYDAPPKMTIDVTKKYTAIIDTDRGTITVDLFAKEAPKTVNNFVFLAKEKFYDGLNFHRVIPDFMIQGGDPEGNGTGGPGYQFEDEVDATTNPHQFQTGTLAMANAGPATNGSQFFITHKPTPWLQGKHTIFGQVRDAKSQDVVNAIQQGDMIKSIKIQEGEEKK